MLLILALTLIHLLFLQGSSHGGTTSEATTEEVTTTVLTATEGMYTFTKHYPLITTSFISPTFLIHGSRIALPLHIKFQARFLPRRLKSIALKF